MKRILLALVLVLVMAGWGWAAGPYYVNATSGDDAAAGTLAAPWKTIAKVNATTLAGDDIVYFNKGDIWYETLLVHDSGSSNHAVTFTSYGTGAKPIISGAIDTSTFAVGTPSELIANGDAETGDTTGWTVSAPTGGTSSVTASNSDKHGGTYAFNMVYSGSTGNQRFSQTVTLAANTWYEFNFWQKKASGADGNILILGPGTIYLQNDLSSWTSTANALTGVTLTSAAWTQTAIVFKTGAAGSYIIRFQQSGNSNCWIDDISLKPCQWEQIGVTTEYKANIYQNKLLNATKSMFTNWDTINTISGPAYYNGRALTLGTATSLTSGQCGWDNTAKTYNINVGNSPLGLDVKIPWRGSNIHLNAKSYITITGLDLRYSAMDDGTNACGSIVAEDTASTNVTITGNDIDNHWAYGVYADNQAHTGWAINSSNNFSYIWNGRAYGSNGNGVGIRSQINMTGLNASSNNFLSCYTGMRAEALGGTFNSNKMNSIMVNGIDHQSNTAANPITIQGNFVDHTPQWAGGHGIDCQVAGHGAIIKNNIVITFVKSGATGQAFSISESNNIQEDNNIWFAAGPGTVSNVLLGYTGQLANTLYTNSATYKTALDGLKNNATVVWTSDGTLGHAAGQNDLFSVGSGLSPTLGLTGGNYRPRPQ